MKKQEMIKEVTKSTWQNWIKRRKSIKIDDKWEMQKKNKTNKSTSTKNIEEEKRKSNSRIGEFIQLFRSLD